MNELLEHFLYIEPDGYLDFLGKDQVLSKEWQQVFFMARCLFSKDSELPIRKKLAPLLERKKIFSENKTQSSHHHESLMKLIMGENFDIGKIHSPHQLSSILPKELISYTEEIFYKKLVNRELNKKEFEDKQGISVNELVYGKDEEVNTRQKIYLLFDNSSSMNGEKFNKLFAAKAICLEYLRKVMAENPQIYFRSFNQEVGQLFKVNKTKQIKELIKNIIHLPTFDCYETRIHQALLTAIEDIKRGPDLQQAEILMITDGMGDIPPDMKRKLGKIKFHVILISALDMDRFLNSYPTKEDWQKDNLTMDMIKESPYYENLGRFQDILVKANQVYALQEISEIFIRIPSLLVEKVRCFSPRELDLIQELQTQMAQKLEGPLTSREKYEIFQRLKFLIKYLHVVLSRGPSKELKARLKMELHNFQHILKKLLEDDVFLADVGISKEKMIQGGEKRFMVSLLKETNTLWLIYLFVYILQSLASLLPKMVNKSHYFANKAVNFFIRTYRKRKIKRRFSFLNNKMSKISHLGHL